MHTTVPTDRIRQRLVLTELNATVHVTSHRRLVSVDRNAQVRVLSAPLPLHQRSVLLPACFAALLQADGQHEPARRFQELWSPKLSCPASPGRADASRRSTDRVPCLCARIPTKQISWKRSSARITSGFTESEQPHCWKTTLQTYPCRRTDRRVDRQDMIGDFGFVWILWPVGTHAEVRRLVTACCYQRNERIKLSPVTKQKHLGCPSTHVR